VLLRAGQTPLEPRSGTASDGTQTEKSHTNKQVGSRKESIPPNAWTEPGRTPVLEGIV
jgi:hypothetical protein